MEGKIPSGSTEGAPPQLQNVACDLLYEESIEHFDFRQFSLAFRQGKISKK